MPDADLCCKFSLVLQIQFEKGMPRARFGGQRRCGQQWTAVDSSGQQWAAEMWTAVDSGEIR
jgi:hypothetical protein